MLFIDANAILRYTLNDNPDMAVKVCELIKANKVSVRYEVLAEVVYVLAKVYSLSKVEIAEGINVFLSEPNVEAESEDVLSLALKTYTEANIDFVDCVLYGFKALRGHEVFTFDKKLNTMINKLAL